MAGKTTVGLKSNAQIVQGSLWTSIWHMTWPMLINMLAFAVGSFVDTWVAGRLSADAQAAMGIGWQIRYFMLMLTMALEIGTLAIISRYFGARDNTNTVEAAKQSLIFAGLFGIASLVVGILASKIILHLLCASPGVEKQCWEYLKWSLVANIPATLLWTSQSIFRGIGNVHTTMVTTIAGTVLIVLFDLLFCLYPFHMGLPGIGLSWIISTTLGFAWNVVKLRDSEIAGCLNVFDSLRAGISKEWFMRFIRIGLPGCVQEIALILGSFGLFYILSKTAQPAINQAAWGVGWRLEELLVLTPMFGLNNAIAIIVGQNLGAQQPQRAEQASWNTVYAGIAINILVAAGLWFFAANIAQAMSTDAAVVKGIIDYLHIVAWTEPMFAMWFILCGATQGAGYTRLPMIITILCFGVLRLLIAWYLTNIYGANGTWTAMGLTSVLAGILMALVFKWERWKHQVI